MTEQYVELHAASAFSFLEAGSQPEALMERAAELEMPAMAIADRNGLYGAARFHTSGQRSGVRAHIGAEVAVESFAASMPGRARAADSALRVAPGLPEPVPDDHAVQDA